MSPNLNKDKLALVLSAGGARAAYQVGVLRHLAEHSAHFNPKIFSGVSAGSINASFLAQGEPLKQSGARLYQLWENLEFEHVLKTNFKSIFAMMARWMSDMFISKVTRKLLLKSLLDASPLTQTLLANIHFWKISKAVRSGIVEGISISATNYHDGTTTIFFDSSEPIAPWRREKRLSIRSTIRVRHIMASCSIPILFEPVRIGDYLFGDGSLRFSFPLSPAIHLGASHILAIGIRCPTPQNPFLEKPDHLSLGFVAGSVLNSIFLDSLDADYENLCRMNEVSDGKQVKRVDVHLVRPSQDLGGMAKEFIDEVPFHFRQLLKTFSTSAAELGDLLSYLMFSKGYLHALLELGMKDAATQHDPIETFLIRNSQPKDNTASER